MHLVLESNGCDEAFGPQVELLRNAERYVTTVIRGLGSTIHGEDIDVHHIVFRKVHRLRSASTEGC